MQDFPLAAPSLARRIEAACVTDLCAYVVESRRSGVYPDAVDFRLAGGAAVWYAPGNVVNGSCGLGMSRCVEAEEIAALIAFFGEHGSPARTDVCPHADRSLLRWLAEARFVATDFEMVLYQPLETAAPAQPAEGVEVCIARTSEERAVWADLEARGFTDERATDDHRTLAQAISLREDVLHFTGYLDGAPAGTGMLSIVDGLAMFNGDSTKPAARNRGVQSAILAARLRHARDSGCDLAVIEAAPGGVSQRNQERAGFRVAYTRVTLERSAQD